METIPTKSQNVRPESAVFSDLENLCISPGYAHAIAYFCERENIIKFEDTLSAEHLMPMYSMNRLIRTEISTLIGLMCKSDIDTSLPTPEKFQAYIDKTEQFLKELHWSMYQPAIQDIKHQRSTCNPDDSRPAIRGHHLREAIFYGGESAYQFQYRDLSLLKYREVNDWFIENKGFSIPEALNVISAITDYQLNKLNSLLGNMKAKAPDELTVLPAYIFTPNDISEKYGIDISTTEAVISSFLQPKEVSIGNFSALDDFNPKNAYPIIELGNKQFMLFQNYSILEALYETPFFWFQEDQEYKNIAMENRGIFTERFSADRLREVFGEENVFCNIDIYDSKKCRLGEIDVLVTYADRAIVLQAKSKKLTIAARKGNDNCLKSDFKKAIQDSYDQGFLCSELIQNKRLKFIDQNGTELDIAKKYKEIYPLCVISDHYPALAAQCKEFLTVRESDTIKSPLIMDVFFLDAISEMLQSPIFFLSYLNRRGYYADSVFSTHELTVLSYHLKNNLFFTNEYQRVLLGDDIAADLDIAMFTRRDGATGKTTPTGILTIHEDTPIGHLLKECNRLKNAQSLQLGLLLLELNQNTLDVINRNIDQITQQTIKDGEHHDIAVPINDGETGLTLHSNFMSFDQAYPMLYQFCELRKYEQKAKTWIGLSIDPTTHNIKFCITLDDTWSQSKKMDIAIKPLAIPQKINKKNTINYKTVVRSKPKVGANERCPCGSGKKFKRCCRP